MNIYIWLLIVVTLQYNDAFQAKKFHKAIQKFNSRTKPIKDLCTEISDVNPDLVDSSKFAGLLPEDDRFKDYVECLFVNLGIVNSIGEIDKDKIKETIGVDDPKIQSLISKLCTNSKGLNLAEKVAKLSEATVYATAALGAENWSISCGKLLVKVVVITVALHLMYRGYIYVTL
ncbi:hypothetical protein FQA39_LY08028 [Lamprigera yunnana]|nr:hypothetical protein FQA39_LY08028 [Lamprigera yunnana]